MFRYETYFSREQIEVFKGLKNINIDSIASILSQLGLADDKYAALGMFLTAKSMECGPKMIQPSYENCVALENTELRIPYENYQQSYPVVIVELPEEYRNALRERWGYPAPLHIMSANDPFIMMSCFGKNDSVGIYMKKLDGIQYIEDCFSFDESEHIDPLEFEMYRRIERVAINLNMVLSNYGHKSLGYHRLGGKKHRHETAIELIAPSDSMIKMYNTARPSTPGEGSHASPRPHWRKGHWRNQPYSLGVKSIFIKPIFVCAYKATEQSNVVTYSD